MCLSHNHQHIVSSCFLGDQVKGILSLVTVITGVMTREYFYYICCLESSYTWELRSHFIIVFKWFSHRKILLSIWMNFIFLLLFPFLSTVKRSLMIWSVHDLLSSFPTSKCSPHLLLMHLMSKMMMKKWKRKAWNDLTRDLRLQHHHLRHGIIATTLRFLITREATADELGLKTRHFLRVHLSTSRKNCYTIRRVQKVHVLSKTRWRQRNLARNSQKKTCKETQRNNSQDVISHILISAWIIKMCTCF